MFMFDLCVVDSESDVVLEASEVSECGFCDVGDEVVVCKESGDVGVLLECSDVWSGDDECDVCVVNVMP